VVFLRVRPPLRIRPASPLAVTNIKAASASVPRPQRERITTSGRRWASSRSSRSRTRCPLHRRHPRMAGIPERPLPRGIGYTEGGGISLLQLVHRRESVCESFRDSNRPPTGVALHVIPDAAAARDEIESPLSVRQQTFAIVDHCPWVSARQPFCLGHRLPPPAPAWSVRGWVRSTGLL
jgi:hypothetical protein